LAADGRQIKTANIGVCGPKTVVAEFASCVSRLCRKLRKIIENWYKLKKINPNILFLISILNQIIGDISILDNHSTALIQISIIKQKICIEFELHFKLDLVHHYIA
jgi:hypothetical protein